MKDDSVGTDAVLEVRMAKTFRECTSTNFQIKNKFLHDATQFQIGMARSTPPELVESKQPWFMKRNDVEGWSQFLSNLLQNPINYLTPELYEIFKLLGGRCTSPI